MENNMNTLTDNFRILFEKLEDAKKEQPIVLQIENNNELLETYNTISLFKEYQESIVESNYSTFTIS